jgi:hypothetical protein
MKFRSVAVWFTVNLSLAAAPADAALIPSADGLTVYDTTLRVTWLANANLAATEKFGISGISPDGTMNFSTALLWVSALNALNGGSGYLGHNHWTIPTTPLVDDTCRATGPNGNFGFGCTGSAMGSLYNLSLAMTYPDTAVSIPPGHSPISSRICIGPAPQTPIVPKDSARSPLARAGKAVTSTGTTCMCCR